MRNITKKAFAFAAALLLMLGQAPSAVALNENPDYWQTIGYGILIDGWFTARNGLDPEQYPFKVEIQQDIYAPNHYRVWKPFAELQEKTGIVNNSIYEGQITFDISDPENVLIELNMPAGFKCPNMQFSAMPPNEEVYIANSLGWIFDLMSDINTAKSYMNMLGGVPSTYSDGIVTITNASVCNSDHQPMPTASTGTHTAYIYMPWAINKTKTFSIGCSVDAFDISVMVDDGNEDPAAISTLALIPSEAKVSYDAQAKAYLIEEAEESAVVSATLKEEYRDYKVADFFTGSDIEGLSFNENGFTINVADYNEETELEVSIVPVIPSISLGSTEKITLVPGQNTELSINISNIPGTEFAGFQTTVILPTGLSVTGAQLGEALAGTGFTTEYGQGYDGNYTGMLVNLKTVTGSTVTEGEILKLTVTAAENANPVIGEITFTNSVFSTNTGSDMNVANEDDLKVEAEIFVEPVGISLTAVSLEGIEGKTEFKDTESFTLTATLEPLVVTNPEIEWTVDQDVLGFEALDEDAHTVKVKINKGVTADNVTITATVKEHPEVNETYVINISALLPGDANDNGVVNVSDVIAIRNEILAQTEEAHSINDNFCFINADVDADGTIDVIDQAATINIALGKDAFPEKASLAKSAVADANRLTANVIYKDNDIDIAVSLENASAYTILQSDILIPEGMEVIEIVNGKQAQHHEVASSLNSNILRVIVYSLSNSTFVSSDEPLFTVKAVSNQSKEIRLANIIAADRYTERHLLGSDITYSEGAGISDSAIDTVSVYGTAGEITIANGEGLTFNVYTIDGKLIESVVANASVVRVPVVAGIYTVVSENKSFKVAVK